MDELIINCVDFNNICQNKDFLQKLRKLTLFPYSGMNHELSHLENTSRHRKVNCKILTASLNEEMVGWALFSKESSSYSFKGTTFKEGDGILFEVYVDPQYRRRGIASKLMKVARRKANGTKICVAPWDSVSKQFFSNFQNYHLQTF